MRLAFLPLDLTCHKNRSAYAYWLPTTILSTFCLPFFALQGSSLKFISVSYSHVVLNEKLLWYHRGLSHVFRPVKRGKRGWLSLPLDSLIDSKTFLLRCWSLQIRLQIRKFHSYSSDPACSRMPISWSIEVVGWRPPFLLSWRLQALLWAVFWRQQSGMWTLFCGIIINKRMNEQRPNLIHMFHHQFTGSLLEQLLTALWSIGFSLLEFGIWIRMTLYLLEYVYVKIPLCCILHEACVCMAQPWRAWMESSASQNKRRSSLAWTLFVVACDNHQTLFEFKNHTNSIFRA